MLALARRRFTLLDALVLIMVTAVVLAAYRWYDFEAF
jgi:hypothetical protein